MYNLVEETFTDIDTHHVNCRVCLGLVNELPLDIAFRSSSSSSSSASRERKKSKKKKKKRKKKKSSKDKEEPKRELEKLIKNEDVKLKSKEKETKNAVKSMKPMTKEEWEKQQSVIKRVYDPETGRNRLVKGDGEILEEIVSKDRHKEINKQSTLGDGVFFQAKMGLNKK